MSIEEKLDLLLTEVAALKSAVAGRPSDPVAPSVNVESACELTGHGSPTAFYRWCRRWKVCPFRPGWYRVADIEAGKLKAVTAARKTKVA